MLGIRVTGYTMNKREKSEKKGYKIVHISDTHCKNLKYHREYREVFENMYSNLRKEKPDCIVHCGDLAHTKTQLSPEYFDLVSDLLKNLADIAPTILILGNHDGNLKNSTRLDAVSPVVKALAHKNIKLLSDAGEYKFDEGLTFNVLSVFDEDNWVKPSDENVVNIALYHGSISGIETDTGYVMEHGDHEIDIFHGHDYALLGDIHKTNQKVNKEGTYRYCGSTIQQNFGETNDKGYLVWDIKGKKDYECQHVVLENPTPFITVELEEDGKLPEDIEVREGSRVRIAGNNKVTIDQLRRAMDVVRQRFKPESITYFNRAGAKRNTVEQLVDGIENEDLRDPAIQAELIEEFLNDYRVDDEVLQKVLELNRRYNVEAEDSEETLRNINWKLKEVSWDNLFNYGTGNKIDFSNLNGVIGIFGKNFSGKSSIIDSFLWTLQNSTSKNVRKNVDIINQNEEYGNGRVVMEIDNETYTIDRSAEKYIKKLKGEETEEAKTELNFSKFDATASREEIEKGNGSLNGIARGETDKNIRKVFGTMDDFLLTSMTSQDGSLAFLNEGSTKRKEILGKFLDLDIFAKKYRLASDDAADIKGALKRIENRDFDTEILDAAQEVKENERTTEKQKSYCLSLKGTVAELKSSIMNIEQRISASPILKPLDVVAARHNLSTLERTIVSLREQSTQDKKSLEAKSESLAKIEELLLKTDVTSAKKTAAEMKANNEEIARLLGEIEVVEARLRRQNKKIELLHEVPCGTTFLDCKFLSDASEAKSDQVLTNKKLVVLNGTLNGANTRSFDLTPEEASRTISEFEVLGLKKVTLSKEVNDLSRRIEMSTIKQSISDKDIQELKREIEEYEVNKEENEQLESLSKERGKLYFKLEEVENDLEDCEEDMQELYKNHGSLEQKFLNLEELKGELSDLRVQYSAYDLYERCMHSNGISYDIIKKRLPFINEEISKVLANVVSFEVFFRDDGKKLDIMIKHPQYDPRPLELGSGAEKMLSAMAIRLALIKISNLPQGDLFILDEPATALDEENMEGFIRIVEMLKTQFKTILIISHLDALKDIVDQQVEIDKVGGYAHVEAS